MASEEHSKILVVDDEEAILETMTFTFEDDYEVLTSTDARKALELLDEHAPVAVVLSEEFMALEGLRRVGVILSGGNVSLRRLPW